MLVGIVENDRARESSRELCEEGGQLWDLEQVTQRRVGCDSSQYEEG